MIPSLSHTHGPLSDNLATAVVWGHSCMVYLQSARDKRSITRAYDIMNPLKDEMEAAANAKSDEKGDDRFKELRDVTGAES